MTTLTPFRGIIPPMVTPLCGQDRIDEAGLECLIEHLVAGGVHGLFLLGTTGEAPGLSHDTRRELIRRSIRQIGGRIPTLVGITDTSFTESIRLAQFTADHGGSAVVLSAPYYFPVHGCELAEYIHHLVPRLPLPVLLYNMPSHTRASFNPDLICRAMDIPHFAGVKDSSGDMIRFHEYLNVLGSRPDLSLLVGPEELLGESVLLGGHGGVCGGANLFPSLYVELYHAALAGNLARVRGLHETVMEIRRTIYSVGRHSSSFIKGLKCALSLRGICDDFMAEPFHRFRTSEREEVQRRLGHVLQRLDAGLVDDTVAFR